MNAYFFRCMIRTIARAMRSPDSHAASIVPGTSNKIDACSPTK